MHGSVAPGAARTLRPQHGATMARAICPSSLDCSSGAMLAPTDESVSSLEQASRNGSPLSFVTASESMESDDSRIARDAPGRRCSVEQLESKEVEDGWQLMSSGGAGSLREQQRELSLAVWRGGN